MSAKGDAATTATFGPAFCRENNIPRAALVGQDTASQVQTHIERHLNHHPLSAGFHMSSIAATFMPQCHYMHIPVVGVCYSTNPSRRKKLVGYACIRILTGICPTTLADHAAPIKPDRDVDSGSGERNRCLDGFVILEEQTQTNPGAARCNDAQGRDRERRTVRAVAETAKAAMRSLLFSLAQ